ncbi:flagellar export chaperone FlgN [Schwartzia sp. (in: firmicutes)]
MDEIIKILRAELALSMKLEAAAQAQREALKANLDGRRVSETTQTVDGLLRQLSVFEKQKEDLLKKAGCESVNEFLKHQPYSKEKMEAKDYLGRLTELLEKIRKIGSGSRLLLKNDMEYLTFSLNVMTQSQAGPGYDDTEQPDAAIQGKKLFDRSV